MTILTLPPNVLRALVPCMAVKDVRFYLKGALIEITADGHVYCVATDGSHLFACRVVAAESTQHGPFSMIIPAETIKAAIKEKRTAYELAALPDGRYTLGGQLFTPIDGRYPDWRRVIPGQDRELSSEPSQHDPQLMLNVQTALAEFDGVNGTRNCHGVAIHYKGSTAIMGKTEHACGVVTPYSVANRNVPTFRFESSQSDDEL